MRTAMAVLGYRLLLFMATSVGLRPDQTVFEWSWEFVRTSKRRENQVDRRFWNIVPIHPFERSGPIKKERK